MYIYSLNTTKKTIKYVKETELDVDCIACKNWIPPFYNTNQATFLTKQIKNNNQNKKITQKPNQRDWIPKYLLEDATMHIDLRRKNAQ